MNSQQQALTLLLAEQSVTKSMQRLLPISSSHLFQYLYHHFTDVLQPTFLPSSFWNNKLFGKTHFTHCTYFEKFCLETYLFQFLFAMNKQLLHQILDALPKDKQPKTHPLLVKLKQELKIVHRYRRTIHSVYELDWKQMAILLQHPVATTVIPTEYLQLWIYLEKHILSLQLCLTKSIHSWSTFLQWYQEMRLRVLLVDASHNLFSYQDTNLTKQTFSLHQMLVQQFISFATKQSIVKLFLSKKNKKKQPSPISTQTIVQQFQVYLFVHFCKKNLTF